MTTVLTRTPHPFTMDADAMDFTSKSSPTSTSPRSRSPNSKNLHLDFSTLPALITPAPPSNTLIITNLNNPQTFSGPTLATIRSHLSHPTPVFSFSPLKSFKRIIVSYPTTEAAIAVRKALDGTAILGDRTRVYFGVPTPLNLTKEQQQLALPESGRLFFISPPPSPPAGWEMRPEEPPNKAVHADDLATALAGLRAKSAIFEEDDDQMEGLEGAGARRRSDEGRHRSGSTTLVYQPQEHGGSLGLPAVTVEDTTEDENATKEDKKIMAHTARPPLELMQ